MDCVFCKFVSGEWPCFKVYEDDYTLAFVALENHVLVIPKVHTDDIFSLTAAHGEAVMKTAVQLAPLVKEVYQADGLNLIQSNGVAAGQEVFHFHLHLKPRFVGDTTMLHWDTATAPQVQREAVATRLVAMLSE